MTRSATAPPSSAGGRSSSTTASSPARLLILETYCPDELPGFRDKFDDLKFDDTIG